RLGYAQATVSQQIATLERAVGGPVFDRPGGPRPVRLTPPGAVLLDHGRDLLAKADQLSEAIDRVKAGHARIDIGTFQHNSPPITKHGWSGRSPAPAHSHGSCFEPLATKPSCQWCGRA